MIKRPLQIIFAVTLLSFAANAQLALNNAGTTLPFYIGQTYEVQAEGDVNNAASATMQFESGGTPTLKLKGNFTNSSTGIYTYGTEMIEFNGSSLQTADFGGDDIYSLKTSNSSNIQLTTDVTVQGNITYSTGDLITSTSAYPTLETGASVSGADDDSHNFGPIAKKFSSTTEFTYPVGDGSYYRYSTFTPASASAVTMRSTYYDAQPTNRLSYGAGIYKISQVEYWDMYRDAGTTDGVITLSWDPVTSGGVGTYTDLTVTHYNGATWEDAGGNNHTGNNTEGDVESDASWASWDRFFTLATTTSNNTLPIELVKFTAYKELEAVRLDWQTASEINSDYFSVQKSENGIDFFEIDQVGAAGQSTELIDYTSFDFTPIAGKNYYRLVNFDHDETFETSEVRVVDFGEDGAQFSINAYPNPVSTTANFTFKAKEDGVYTMNLYSITGSLVYSGKIVGPVGENAFTLNMDTYENGKYIAQLISPSQEVITLSVEKIK